MTMDFKSLSLVILIFYLIYRIKEAAYDKIVKAGLRSQENICNQYCLHNIITHSKFNIIIESNNISNKCMQIDQHADKTSALFIFGQKFLQICRNFFFAKEGNLFKKSELKRINITKIQQSNHSNKLFCDCSHETNKIKMIYAGLQSKEFYHLYFNSIAPIQIQMVNKVFLRIYIRILFVEHHELFILITNQIQILFNLMDASIIATQLQNHKIRQGQIYKRSKFLQEWQERWMVLTMNYIFVFANRQMKELVDFIDLRDLQNYKSYLRKDDDMIPAGFKLTAADEMYYLCARNSNQKWSWMVSIERIMDFKYAGKSMYNNIEWLKSRGFMSQDEYQKGRFEIDVKPKQSEVPKIEEKPKDVPKINEKDLEKLKLELEQERKAWRQKADEAARKQKEQEQMFIFELNKLKKAEESLKQLQAQVQLKSQEAERIINEASLNPKQIIVQKHIEIIVQKIVQKPVEVIVEKKVEVEAKKQQQPPKPIEQPEPVIAKRQSTLGHKVSEMKKIYESKMDVGKVEPTINKSVAPQKSKEDNKTKQDFLHLCRDKVVVNLFQQFHKKAYSYPGLRAIVQFIIKICSDRSLGYQSYFIREAKSHQNRFVFAQVFLELISNNKDASVGKSLSKLVQVLIFEVPGIFKLNHFDIIKKKMYDLFFSTEDQNDLAAILKTMYVVHKVKKYEKDEKLHHRLKQIQNIKSQEAKNWSRKLLEDI